MFQFELPEVWKPPARQGMDVDHIKDITQTVGVIFIRRQSNSAASDVNPAFQLIPNLHTGTSVCTRTLGMNQHLVTE